MGDHTTGAMQEFGASAPPSTRGHGPAAGLVLLYAEEFLSLPAAWPFQSHALTIGRDPSSDVALPVKAVSRQHARISWDRGHWTIEDLGSTNGTIVDGRRVTRVDLEPMHEVRVGDAILKFVERDAHSLARYRLDGTLMAGNIRLSEHTTAIAGGFQMDRISSELCRVAPSPLSVLLLGESGTGKEVVARELHRLSQRKGGFYAVNCGAIPENLIESELFGYKRGAFSGADRDKPGIFRAAHGGTLLLDEIGDMPESAQVKLLRVLQSKEIYPVGSNQPESVDVRVVCATHRDLDRLQAQGQFREDLFARINEYQVKLPPLRERKEDIYQLVLTFLARHQNPDARPTFSFMTGLLHYEWPYNVRELEACIKRATALSTGPSLDEALLPDPVREAMNDYARRGAPLAQAAPAEGGERGRSPTEEELRQLLTEHQGNVAAVGRALGKARMQIHRWLSRYGIDLAEFRAEAESKKE